MRMHNMLSAQTNDPKMKIQTEDFNVSRSLSSLLLTADRLRTATGGLTAFFSKWGSDTT